MKTTEDLIKLILEIINKLPDPPRENLKKEMTKIMDIVFKSRPPRIMIIGRRGSGKSSLINAIFKKKVAEVGSVTAETAIGKWYLYESENGKLEIMDTRGLGDSNRPKKSNFEKPIDEIKEGLKEKLPDVILFLVKAKEVDARIDEDIESVKEIRKLIKEAHSYDIPLLAAVTQVDELDPVDVLPPYEDDEKVSNIDKAVNQIKKLFQQKEIDLLNIIPVSSYARFNQNGEVLAHRFWNIDKLVEYLIDNLPLEAQLEMVRIAKIINFQKKLARIIIGSTATICAGIAATPIPIADILPITGAQITMIISIGYIGGNKLDNESARKFLTALGLELGVSVALRELARALVKFAFPGVGNIISAGVAFGGTWAIGEAAILYFIDGKSIEEAKNIFNLTKSQKENEYDKK